MKKIVVLLILLFSIDSNAQTKQGWDFGLSWTPSIRTDDTPKTIDALRICNIGIDALRKYNDRWELELHIFYWFYRKDISTTSDTSIEKSHSIGVSIGTRYNFIELDKLRLYTSILLGTNYQDWQRSHTYTPYTETANDWYINYSLRLGSEIFIKQKFWSLDLNLGYLGLTGLDPGSHRIDNLIFSIGVLKWISAE